MLHRYSETELNEVSAACSKVSKHSTVAKIIANFKESTHSNFEVCLIKANNKIPWIEISAISLFWKCVSITTERGKTALFIALK